MENRSAWYHDNDITEEDKKIEELQAEIDNLQARKKLKLLPRKKIITTIEFQRSKEENYNTAEELGLNEEQLNNFIYFTLINVTIEIDEKGNVFVIGVNGNVLVNMKKV